MLTLRDTHFALLRKKAIGDGLVKSFEGSKQFASRHPTTGDVLLRDPKGNTTKVTFDNSGFIGGVESPTGRRWRLDNGPSGRVTGLSNPAGLRLGVGYNEQDQVSKVSRDSREILQFEYDDQSQLKKISYPDRTSVRLDYQEQGKVGGFTNRLGQKEEYAYDDAGNLTSISDANGNRSKFLYSTWDRPDAIRYPDGSTESYEYSLKGLVQRIASGAETVAEIQHNDKGQPIEICYGDGEVLSFAYDEAGNVIQARNAELDAKYEYDSEGRVVLEDRGGQVIKYQYDECGSLVGMTYPSGETVEFSYDADLRLTSVKDWHDDAHNFVYARDDRGITHYLPNDLVTTIRQSKIGLPVSVAVSKAGATDAKLFSFEFQYDEEDRVQEFTDSGFGVRKYFYDPESQLVAVKASDLAKEESFAYDKAFNRIRSSDDEASFNNLNQLVSQGDRRCEYDSAGNLMLLSRPSGEWRFAYNRRNLLIRAEGPDRKVVTFGYDAFGRRVWKRSGTSEVRYTWAGEHLIREVVKSDFGSRTRDYLYFPGTYTPLAMRLDGQTYYYHTDHLGTPRRMTDAKGAIVWSADYSAFGRVQTVVSEVSNPLRFPGQYFDFETGLYYNRFRYYSPALGRYLSRDPVSFLAGLNLYAYAENNPVGNADPLGLWTWKALVGGGLAGAAAGVFVLALAPAAIPVAILTGALIAGAVAAGLNDALHGNSFCVPCFWKGFFGALAIEAGAALAAAGLVAAFIGGGPPALGGLALAGVGGAGALSIGLSAEQLMALGLAGAGALVARGMTVAMMKGPPSSEGSEPPEAKEKVDEVLKDADVGKESSKTKQYRKTGGIDQANRDFDELEPTNIQTRPGGLRTGELQDGSKINVRPFSKYGKPTLEIQPPSGKTIKVRYYD